MAFIVDGVSPTEIIIDGNADINVLEIDGVKYWGKPFTLTMDNGAGTNIIVNRISSPNQQAGIFGLSSGSLIYYGDVLEITAQSIGSDYTLTEFTVNGETWTSGNTITVGEHITVKTTAQQKSWHTVWTGSVKFITSNTTNTEITQTVDGVVAGRPTRVSGNATVTNIEGDAFTNIELTSSPTNINLVYIGKYNKMYPPTIDNSLTASVVSRGTMYRNSGIVLKEVQQYY